MAVSWKDWMSDGEAGVFLIDLFLIDWSRRGTTLLEISKGVMFGMKERRRMKRAGVRMKGKEERSLKRGVSTLLMACRAFFAA